VSAFVALVPLDDGEDLVPHPELVRAQKPTVGLFMASALCLGVFPDPAASYLSGEARVSLPVR
jgi:hypothetical protein